MKSILIANRGEIAIRIAQAAAELGMESVAVHPDDDAACLHVHRADRTVRLEGKGPQAYLDIAGVVEAARAAGCDAVHPGYGFLAESAPFARAVAEAGLTFIGPSPETLERLGDKVSALVLAREIGAPVNPGLGPDATADDIRAFMAGQGGAPVVLKAAAGGGGRGMRVVTDPAAVEEMMESASREAEAAFGDGTVFAERYLERARHIEVQIVGDGTDAVHVWERDCSLQRRHQKIVEIAPAPALDPKIRRHLLEAAVAMAKAADYKGLGTFEFLVGHDGTLAFIEANPRVQVEHTVTEAVTGLDLVRTQIRIAAGESLADLGLSQDRVPSPRGAAVQVRVNLERIAEDGGVAPTGGTLSAYEQPGGPGVRVDGHGYAGLRTSPLYDSLLAKVIGHSPEGLAEAAARTRRALRGFRIEGVQTNIPHLQALLALPEVVAGETYTRLIEDRTGDLFRAAAEAPAPLAPAVPAAPDGAAAAPRRSGPAGNDPLGVLAYGKADAKAEATPGTALGGAEQEPGDLSAPLQGTILSIEAAIGDTVGRGVVLFTMESMKMHHAVYADRPGVVRRLLVEPGDTVFEGDALAVLDPTEAEVAAVDSVAEIDLDRIRPDLAEVLERKALLRDEARPEAVARRRRLDKRTARENVADLTDADSFLEYGDLIYAAQTFRRSKEDLIRSTPADGLVAGFGTVNADLFGPEASRAAVLAYDYTVLAGTQGVMNHEKKDRMIDVIRRQRLPLVFFCEGGGGRPGDVDSSDTMIAGLFMTTFWHHAQLSGLVPMVGIGSGRVFAGNAALLGCCDVVIATRDTCLGMGGPAMIEGGGLGVFRPEEVGPTSVQVPNGCIDVLVEDEVEAVAVAKKYLSYFQGRLRDWTAPDPRRLRHVVPENRLEVYDMRGVVEGIADEGSVLELRPDYARGMITALARIEGRPVGIVGNNPIHLSGAIDSPASDKASRFIKLCDAFDIPLVTLIDTPGMMVGPEIEKTALVRHCSRLFLAGANVEVPMVSIIARKSYGLGAQAMAGGSFRTPLFIVGWPTAEIGGMGLEGAVKLGYRKELEAIEDVAERQVYFEAKVAESYERGKAINAASILEFDTVIDPADTRRWIVAALDAAPPSLRRTGKKRAFVDSW